jgi:hypothetical protein
MPSWRGPRVGLAVVREAREGQCGRPCLPKSRAELSRNLGASRVRIDVVATRRSGSAWRSGAREGASAESRCESGRNRGGGCDMFDHWSKCCLTGGGCGLTRHLRICRVGESVEDGYSRLCRCDSLPFLDLTPFRRSMRFIRIACSAGKLCKIRPPRHSVFLADGFDHWSKCCLTTAARSPKQYVNGSRADGFDDWSKCCLTTGQSAVWPLVKVLAVFFRPERVAQT